MSKIPTIWGGTGDEIFTADPAGQVIYGGAGNDIVLGGRGRDVLVGDAGRDLIHGGGGDDSLWGGGEIDTVHGGEGHDKIWGDGGSDIIDGGAGNDTIYGGKGNDTLIGGQLKNGFSAGNDTFVWARSDVVNPDGSSAGIDRITDFGAGDRLDFSAILPSNDAATDLAAVHLRSTEAGTMISVDVGGAGGVMDVVLLQGLQDLDISDLAASGSLIV